MKKNLKGLLIVLIFTALFICLFAVKSYADEYEFNVTDEEFGAIPNDNIDDRDAINDALRKAKTLDGHVTVYIPEGEYLISDQLYIYSDTQLLLDENAVIKSIDGTNAPAMLMGLNEDLSDEHGGYTRIHDITITGGTWDRNSSSNVLSNVFVLNHGKDIAIDTLTVKHSTDHMINISACNNVSVVDVTFKDQIAYTGTNEEYWGDHTIGDVSRHGFTEALHTDFAGDGDKATVPLDGTACSIISVNNCTFDNVLSGVGNHHGTDESRGNNITVSGCNFTNLIYGATFDAWSFDDFYYADNTMVGSDVALIVVDSNGLIENNTMTATGNTSNYGIVHLDNANVDVVGNTITNASKFAIMVSGGNNSIIGNTINGAATDGVRVDNADSIIVENNQITNVKRYAVFLTNCADSQNINKDIKGNTILNNNSISGEAGVFIENCGTNYTIRENTISGKFNNHISVQGTNGTINNNILDNSLSNTIQLNNTNTIIKSNKITNAKLNGMYLINGTYQVLDNTIENSATDGIRADAVDTITIRNNKLKNTTRYGMFITNTTNGATISSNEITGTNTNTGIFIEKCSGNNLIEKNTVKSGSYAGIAAFKCIGTISDNIVIGLSGDAVQTMGDSENVATFTIRDNILKTSSTSNYDLRLLAYSKNCTVDKNVFGNRGLNAANGVTYKEIKLNGIRTDENGVSRYYKDGVETNTTGLVQSSGTWYYVENGVLNTGYTDLVYYNNNWYYVQKGVLNWGVETLVYHSGTWYYVKNSTLDWNYTGLCYYSGSWYYVQKGVLKWGVETLVQYRGTWYYVKNSTLDWGYTGLCYYGGSWYYIQKGQLNWGKETLVYHSGTWYYVKNSTLDWNYTGLCYYGGSWYYIQKGVLKWGYNGTITFNGKNYNIKNSTVV